MKPLLHPVMVNGPFEDPVLYVDFLFERRALLFDLGNLRALPPRKLLRVTDVFVTHTHMDHFQDFDWFLRLILGRDLTVRFHGPAGFLERVERKIGAYTWDLVRNYENDLRIVVTELNAEGRGRRATLELRGGFTRSGEETLDLPGNVLLDDPSIRVRAAILDHGEPCLGFAVEEKLHVNVWKSRLEEMGLPAGPWLRDLRRRVLNGDPDEARVTVAWEEDGAPVSREVPLGDLRARAVRLTPGQKLAYAVDVAYTAENARRVVDLVRDADTAFLEAAFLHEDVDHAARKNHLTARQAGTLAREAGVKTLEPIHHSPRYEDREEEIRGEALRAFDGTG